MIASSCSLSKIMPRPLEFASSRQVLFLTAISRRTTLYVNLSTKISTEMSGR